jgi:hypothetical protein
MEPGQKRKRDYEEGEEEVELPHAEVEKSVRNTSKQIRILDFWASILPLNAVLLITTHGQIRVYEEPHSDEAEKCDIPDGLELMKLNWSPAGVCSVMSATDLSDVNAAFKSNDTMKFLKKSDKESNLTKYTDNIKKKMREKYPDLSESSDPEYLENFMRELQKTIRPMYEEIMPKDDPEYKVEEETLPKAFNLHLWKRVGEATTPASNVFVHYFVNLLPKPYETTINFIKRITF